MLLGKKKKKKKRQQKKDSKKLWSVKNISHIDKI